MFRFDIINQLIQKRRYKRYLEIGVEGGDAVRAVRCELKHGVDPASKNATFQVPSDEFFGIIRPDLKYDCIFVDGLHTEDQTMRDIENSLAHLSAGGVIVVHDVNPPTEWHQRKYEIAKQNGCRQWNGTVWRAWVRLRAERPDLSMACVDTDWGCGIIEPGEQQCIQLLPGFTYAEFEAERAHWLNLITPAEFRTRYIES